MNMLKEKLISIDTLIELIKTRVVWENNIKQFKSGYDFTQEYYNTFIEFFTGSKLIYEELKNDLNDDDLSTLINSELIKLSKIWEAITELNIK